MENARRPPTRTSDICTQVGELTPLELDMSDSIIYRKYHVSSLLSKRYMQIRIQLSTYIKHLKEFS